MLQGRFHAAIDDIDALALPVHRQRMEPTFDAEVEGVTVNDLIARVLKAIQHNEATRPL